ncbi:microtubule-destabilizing protein 60-like [Gastrolobium bilobum]|uniref:microtubule-destabilizing protein 60-like n=1 Tax=Gastrolobium bilobum TaxID=150636 RepID=UPI002AB2ADE2|nr:microtubule-destabilizing protein 60-like [Gastrolobium bilobum]
MIQDLDNEGRKIVDEEREEEEDEDNGDAVEGSSMVKRRRDRLLEEARNSVPESGSGRVMHLVKAFEKLLSLHKTSYKEKDEKEEEEEEDEKQHHHHHHDGENSKNKVMKWALPGLQLQQPPKASETEVSASGSSLFCCTSELVLTSENLGLDKRVSVSSSWDSSRGSVSSRTSGGRRSRRNSLESSGTLGGKRWKKKQQLKVTSQKPFKLRTEQRGKLKEEEFTKKVQEMMTEEEKLRIPIAQGLPWTTDEPECLLKPPVKESTKPIDLKLHSDVRAIDRAEFDHQVAEKMSLIEQQKFEMERQNKLAEEEEIRRLRKALIPKAQPMPYFDRPFVPRRSMKHPTIPREPKFHIPHHKKIKCCLSWNDMSPYSSYLN